MNEDQKIFNKNVHKTQRQVLRHNMPAPEIILWSKLKSKQLYGLKFRRQYGVGNYIIDFYCPSERLAIEIDGNSHYGQGNQEYDELRQKHIELLGIRFLRFTNDEIMTTLDSVLARIEEFVNKPPLTPP